MSKFTVYENALKKEETLNGVIKVVQFSKEFNSDILILDFDGVEGIITRDELDMNYKWKSLVGFVGREVFFKVIGVEKDKNRVLCSRKLAQAEINDSVMEKLNSGAEVDATIINILKYGAYIDFNGVSGLLKNTDFSEDYTAVGDIKSVGDVIKVRLKKITDKNKLTFEAVEKYKNPTIMNFDIFQRDQVVLGKVKNVQPWGIFVNIAPGLDALCGVPSTGEIAEDMSVTIRITQVDAENKRVRGKILQVRAI